MMRIIWKSICCDRAYFTGSFYCMKPTLKVKVQLHSFSGFVDTLQPISTYPQAIIDSSFTIITES